MRPPDGRVAAAADVVAEDLPRRRRPAARLRVGRSVGANSRRATRVDHRLARVEPAVAVAVGGDPVVVAEVVRRPVATTPDPMPDGHRLSDSEEPSQAGGHRRPSQRIR